jgi:hypothetical protein
MADNDIDDEQIENLPAPAADPVLIAFRLIDLALNPKAAKAGLKQLVKLNKDIGLAEEKFVSLQSQAAAIENALTVRAAELDAQARSLDARVAAFESQAADVRDELREHHNRIEQAHRQLVHRIMATTGITGNWNFDLQGVPSWEQLRRQIADLPADLPAPAAEVVTREVMSDWVGHTFVPGSSLTRTIRGGP